MGCRLSEVVVGFIGCGGGGLLLCSLFVVCFKVCFVGPDGVDRVRGMRERYSRFP